MHTRPWRGIAAAAFTLITVLAGHAATAPPAAGAGHEVQITDSAFATPVLTIRVGDTVTWNNVDDRPHTVTGEDGTFDSGTMDEGASFSFTFTAPGTYAYICAFHPEMRATIVVEAAPADPTQAAAPSAAPASAPPTDRSTGAQAADHGAHDGEQPNTALPDPTRPGPIPPLSFLLLGAGLVVGGLALSPPWTYGRAEPTPRPRGGWQR